MREILIGNPVAAGKGVELPRRRRGRWELKLESTDRTSYNSLRRHPADQQSVLRVQAPSPLDSPVCSYLIDKATSRCNYCERPHNVFGAYTPPSARPTHIVGELKYTKYTKYTTLLLAKTIRRMWSKSVTYESNTCVSNKLHNFTLYFSVHGKPFLNHTHF